MCFQDAHARLVILYNLYALYDELPLEMNPFLTFFLEFVGERGNTVEKRFVRCILDGTVPRVSSRAGDLSAYSMGARSKIGYRPKCMPTQRELCPFSTGQASVFESCRTRSRYLSVSRACTFLYLSRAPPVANQWIHPSRTAAPKKYKGKAVAKSSVATDYSRHGAMLAEHLEQVLRGKTSEPRLIMTLCSREKIENQVSPSPDMLTVASQLMEEAGKRTLTLPEQQVSSYALRWIQLLC